eukprot:gene6089-11474_t
MPASLIHSLNTSQSRLVGQCKSQFSPMRRTSQAAILEVKTKAQSVTSMEKRAPQNCRLTTNDGTGNSKRLKYSIDEILGMKQRDSVVTETKERLSPHERRDKLEQKSPVAGEQSKAVIIN